MNITFEDMKGLLKPLNKDYCEATQLLHNREWYKCTHTTEQYDCCNPLAEQLPKDAQNYLHCIFPENNMKLFMEIMKPTVVQFCYCEASAEQKTRPEVIDAHKRKLYRRIQLENRKKQLTKSAIISRVNLEIDDYMDEAFKNFRPHYHVVCFSNRLHMLDTLWTRNKNKEKYDGRIIKFNCMDHVGCAINYCRKQQAQKIETDHLHSQAGGIFCNFSTKNCNKCDNTIECRFRHEYFKCFECAQKKLVSTIQMMSLNQTFTLPTVMFKDLAMWYRNLPSINRLQYLEKAPYKLLTYDIPLDRMIEDRKAWDLLYKHCQNQKRSNESYPTKQILGDFLERKKTEYEQYPVYEELKNFHNFKTIKFIEHNVINFDE